MIFILMVMFLLISLGAHSLGNYFSKGDHDVALSVAIFILLGSALGFCISFLIMIGLVVECAKVSTIPAQIDLLETENREIEIAVTEYVRKSQDQEIAAYKELQPEQLIITMQAYPELKGVALSEQQLNIYINNATTLRDLKLQNVKSTVIRWWLYFGK